ncbi:MAG: prepilin-type N-terminal cleavage/methylation domain-containing protein, partial [Kiritimatiellia bacterium]|nr:prepilin-type N-terminal cleavage/methylation domain-containing protein [Kiritimatiellia bacterium]
MSPPAAIRHRDGFTFVELLLAIALSALVAGILGMLIHGLLITSHSQTQRQQGPFSARAALRTLSREVACAFVPPVQDRVPLTLTTSTAPGEPVVRLAFFVPLRPVPPPPTRTHSISTTSPTRSITWATTNANCAAFPP